MTARDLITAALLKIGEIGQGELMSNEDAQAGLDRLNQLLLSWSNDRLNIPKITSFTGALVATKQTYTCGTGGDLSTPRPVKIQSAAIILNGITQVLNILTAPQWRDIKEKAVTGQLPTDMYPDYDFPLSTLYFWPIPSGTPSVVLDYWSVLQGGTVALNDTISLPPGYERALILGLAIELAPEYGRPFDDIMRQFTDAYSIIRNNRALDTTGAFGESRVLNAPRIGEPAGSSPVPTPSGPPQ